MVHTAWHTARSKITAATATTVTLSGGTKLGQNTGDGQASNPSNNENWRNSTTFSSNLPQ